RVNDPISTDAESVKSSQFRFQGLDVSTAIDCEGTQSESNTAFGIWRQRLEPALGLIRGRDFHRRGPKSCNSTFRLWPPGGLSSPCRCSGGRESLQWLPTVPLE